MFDTSGLVIDNEDEDDEEIINDEGEFNGEVVGFVAKVEQQNTSSSSSKKNSKIKKATKQSSAKSNEKEKIVPSEKSQYIGIIRRKISRKKRNLIKRNLLSAHLKKIIGKME